MNEYSKSIKELSDLLPNETKLTIGIVFTEKYYKGGRLYLEKYKRSYYPFDEDLIIRYARLATYSQLK